MKEYKERTISIKYVCRSILEPKKDDYFDVHLFGGMLSVCPNCSSTPYDRDFDYFHRKIEEVKK